MSEQRLNKTLILLKYYEIKETHDQLLSKHIYSLEHFLDHRLISVFSKNFKQL